MNKNVIIILLTIVLLFSINRCSNTKKTIVDKYETELRKEKLKRDTLQKINEGLYSKLIADTLKKKELEKEIKELGIKLKEALAVGEIELQPETIIKEVIDTVYIDSLKRTAYIKDFYPDKEEVFVEYSANIDIEKGTTSSRWEFRPIPINIVMGYNDKNELVVLSKVPEYIKINNLSLQSRPQEKTKKKTFGWITGVGAGIDLDNKYKYLTLNTGIRISKSYLMIGAGTNNNIQLTFSTEIK